MRVGTINCNKFIAFKQNKKEKGVEQEALSLAKQEQQETDSDFETVPCLLIGRGPDGRNVYSVGYRKVGTSERNERMQADLAEALVAKIRNENNNKINKETEYIEINADVEDYEK